MTANLPAAIVDFLRQVRQDYESGVITADEKKNLKDKVTEMDWDLGQSRISTSAIQSPFLSPNLSPNWLSLSKMSPRLYERDLSSANFSGLKQTDSILTPRLSPDLGQSSIGPSRQETLNNSTLDSAPNLSSSMLHLQNLRTFAQEGTGNKRFESLHSDNKHTTAVNNKQGGLSIKRERSISMAPSVSIGGISPVVSGNLHKKQARFPSPQFIHPSSTFPTNMAPNSTFPTNMAPNSTASQQQMQLLLRQQVQSPQEQFRRYQYKQTLPVNQQLLLRPLRYSYTPQYSSQHHMPLTQTGQLEDNSVSTYPDVLLNQSFAHDKPQFLGRDTVDSNSSRPVGTSCHQCKIRRDVSDLAFCTRVHYTKIKKIARRCQKKFCVFCLKRSYGEVLTTKDLENYICPCCRDICTCLSCRKKRNHIIVNKTAKQPLAPQTDNPILPNDMLKALNNLDLDITPDFDATSLLRSMTLPDGSSSQQSAASHDIEKVAVELVEKHLGNPCVRTGDSKVDATRSAMAAAVLLFSKLIAHSTQKEAIKADKQENAQSTDDNNKDKIK